MNEDEKYIPWSKIWGYIAGAIVIIVCLVIFVITAKSHGYADGRKDGIRQEREIRLKHPKTKYVYRDRVVKKHIPVVHIENATGKQKAEVMKKTHENDLASIRKINHQFSDNKNKGLSSKQIKKLHAQMKKSNAKNKKKASRSSKKSSKSKK